MNLDDPVILALLRLYAKHHWFFCNHYNGRFRLLVTWLTEDWTGHDPYAELVRFKEDISVPWYSKSQELISLAGILRVYPGDLYKKLKELENE